MARIRFISFLFLVLWPLQALADVVIARDPRSLVAYFHKKGVPVTVTEDRTGDPVLEVPHGDMTSRIYFFGCDEGWNCSSIQFFQSAKPARAMRSTEFNEWNTYSRYTRAYFTDAGAVRLEYDIFLGDFGMEQSDFDVVYSHWTQSLESFEAFIGR